jgi:hypothetical protein
MLNPDAFLLTLYVVVDDFCNAHPDLVRRCLPARGPKWDLSVSEVCTLSIFAQWARFQRERGFYRFAEQCLRPLFPKLPHRSQFNRSSRACLPVLAEFFVHLADQLGATTSRFEVLDRFGIATRASGRRGGEWLHGYADKGLCTRLGFFHGMQILSAVTTEGIFTGFGLGSGSCKDQPMAETFLELRYRRTGTWPWIGKPVPDRIYVLDKGFSGPHLHLKWQCTYPVQILCAPQPGHGQPWPKPLRRALAGFRQIVETAHDKLLNWFGLERERPHCMNGLFTRVAAKISLHNFCIWLNRQIGRPDLAFADLLGS